MIYFVVFGASGDLAQRKTFPALISLIKHGILSVDSLKIIGFARTAYSNTSGNHNDNDDEFHSKFNLSKHFTDPSLIQKVKSSISYQQASYDSLESYEKLYHSISQSFNFQQDQLICYLALPPSLFLPVCSLIHQVFSPSFMITSTSNSNESFKLKIVIEKPFGTNLSSCMELSTKLGALFHESQIYRIDHYLGKEMVKNILTLRFLNHFFAAIWNKNHISNVQITFKETLGLESRAGYFDAAGILRDVFQNHLLQILSIIAMEPPIELTSECIQNEKVKLLKCVNKHAISRESCVFGQYKGYLQETGVKPASRTCTFATVMLNIENERWSGVPFVLKCGKALDESKAEIRIQLKDTPDSLRWQQQNVFGVKSKMSTHDEEEPIAIRNELVIRVQPNEAIYLKLTLKKPGSSGLETEIAELDLSYASRFKSIRIPDAYESLIWDVVAGDRSSFVRDDELQEAWMIADPLIELSEASTTPIISYAKGSRGPEESDLLVGSLGLYQRSAKKYHWPRL